jgi:hypothetical protein
MVLCLKARESRSLPGLPRAVELNLRYMGADLNLRYRALYCLSAHRDPLDTIVGLPPWVPSAAVFLRLGSSGHDQTQRRHLNVSRARP